MRLRTLCVAVVAGLAGVIALAGPAHAATLDQKIGVINNFTQATQASANAWNQARLNQSAWADYQLDWSTDYCSASPDQPLGFDFRMPCWRHDFGYRNYKAVGAFPANKSHVDSTFYYDLKTKCATYSIFVRSACYGLAWTYYQAVVEFGSLVVPQSTVDRFAASKAAAERSAE